MSPYRQIKSSQAATATTKESLKLNIFYLSHFLFISIRNLNLVRLKKMKLKFSVIFFLSFASAFGALNLTKENNDDEAYFPRLPELPVPENPSEEQVIQMNT